MLEANRIVFRIVRTKAVGTDHFREAVGLVSRRRVATAPHLGKAHTQAGFGELPGSFASGESAADDVNVEGHGAR